MPGVNHFNASWFEHKIAELMADVRALQTQQQMTLSNLHGQAVLNFGLVPGSNPAAYGLQFVNPATGGQLMFVGEDGSGNAYMAFYDAAGHPRVRQGPLPDGNYGLAVYSPANDGTYVELSNLGFGLQSAEVSTSQGTTSAGTYVDLATAGPSVTVTVGTSGRALVSASALMFPGASGAGNTSDTAFVGLSIDGGAPGNSLAQFTGASGTGVSNNGSGTIGGQVLVTGLSAGSHTCKLQYTTLNGTFTSFQNRVITVQPF